MSARRSRRSRASIRPCRPPPGRSAPARARLLPRRAAARARRPRRRCGPRLRARDRRVRRHDHVRRLAPGRDADALARDLRAVRPRLQRGSRDQRRARAHQRPDPPLRQAPDPMALSVDFTHPLRSFDASRRADGRAAAPRRPSWGRRVPARRRCCGSSRGCCGRSGAIVSLGDRRLARYAGGNRRSTGARQRRLPVPGVRAVPAPRRARERPLRHRAPRLGATRCSSGSGSPT